MRVRRSQPSRCLSAVRRPAFARHLVFFGKLCFVTTERPVLGIRSDPDEISPRAARGNAYRNLSRAAARVADNYDGTWLTRPSILSVMPPVFRHSWLFDWKLSRLTLATCREYRSRLERFPFFPRSRLLPCHVWQPTIFRDKIAAIDTATISCPRINTALVPSFLCK